MSRPIDTCHLLLVSRSTTFCIIWCVCRASHGSRKWCERKMELTYSHRFLLSPISPSMQAGIRPLTTTLNNAGRYKSKVRRRVPSYKISTRTFSHYPAPKVTRGHSGSHYHRWRYGPKLVISCLSCQLQLKFSCSPGTRGVIGLAVARALLQRFPDKSTILIERRTRSGEETR